MESKYYEIRHNFSKKLWLRIKTFANNDVMVIEPDYYRVEIEKDMADHYLTKIDLIVNEITREQFALSYSFVISEQIKNI